MSYVDEVIERVVTKIPASRNSIRLSKKCWNLFVR